MENKDIKYTWDLTDMYQNSENWYKDVEEVNKMAEQIISRKGRITKTAENLYNTLQLYDKLSIKLSSIYVYAKMYFDQNMSNPEAKELYELADNLNTKIQDLLSFLEPELLLLDKRKYGMYLRKTPELTVYNHMFEKLFQKREHILTPKVEEILTRMNSLGNSFEKVYDDLTVNDMVFPEVKGSDEKKIIANNANYYKVLTSRDRFLRKNYFKGLLSTYGKYINSLTSVYYGSVKNNVFLARTRKFKTARHMALHENFIPEKVYDNLITTVRENVQYLQDYISLRKKLLNLDQIHFYDLFVPLVKDINKTYTYEEAQELVLQATSVLGSDYTNTLKEAFNNRWIDVYPGKNKISGAYAIHAYGHHPYSLLNFTGTLGDVFTLAHELGHVMHSYYSSQNQPFVNSEYTIFTAEVASTVNEQLLFNYLLKNTSTKDEKAYLLSNHLDNIRSTLYRQTLFADFENETHKIVENDKPLLPQTLCNLHKELYKIYHGKEFIIDDELCYEWARIPHFYNAFYVYQYATGISAAIFIANRILEEGETAVKDYKTFLSKGGSDYSINLLKITGVDMTKPEPIQNTIKNFEKTLNELKKIV